ncbi:XapX domain-containing protein [Selenihalanaerobacter shriftii]|uniref:XapX domain-containing protein n=1 Tax=Selenihalanaerobacter shriftii TaxID=142842 RepID=UPI00099A5E57|nr:DUF1427 family protein [Selenihalanaerobacter shriftii]
MKLALLSTLSGFILGSIFSFLNLPIPAPPNLAGVMGIIGIYLGYLAINTYF